MAELALTFNGSIVIFRISFKITQHNRDGWVCIRIRDDHHFWVRHGLFSYCYVLNSQISNEQIRQLEYWRVHAEPARSVNNSPPPPNYPGICPMKLFLHCCSVIATSLYLWELDIIKYIQSVLFWSSNSAASFLSTANLVTKQLHAFCVLCGYHMNPRQGSIKFGRGWLLFIYVSMLCNLWNLDKFR